MSTTLTRVDLGMDHWVQFPATWEIYLGMLNSRGEKSRPKYTYVHCMITVVSPGTFHEVAKKRLGGLIEDILVGLMIDYYATGEVTLLKNLRPRTGNEADESYYLTNIDKVFGKKDLMMGQDPPPDLMVEVVVSHPEADALEAYRLFKVREVWVLKDTGLEFLALGDDGRYSPTPTSTLLPFLTSEELTPWVVRQGPEGDMPARRQFRAWVEDTLAPRHRPAADH